MAVNYGHVMPLSFTVYVWPGMMLLERFVALGDDAMLILCSLLLDFFLCRIYFGKGNYNFGIDSYDPRITTRGVENV